jgi:hypothetical protein
MKLGMILFQVQVTVSVLVQASPSSVFLEVVVHMVETVETLPLPQELEDLPTVQPPTRYNLGRPVVVMIHPLSKRLAMVADW